MIIKSAMALLAASLSLAMSAVFPSTASAKENAMSRQANVILVHGAWADGSSWSKVIPLLVARGVNVTAVQLPLTTLDDDVATVKRALALETGPTILVGHSYGGAVITEAGNDPKVSGLVYVAAFAPDAGQSAGSMQSGAPPAPMGAQLKPDAQGFLKLSREGVFEDFAQDLSPEEKLVLFAAQSPTNAKSLGGVITTAAWRGKRSWYIIASQDRAIPPELEAIMAKTLGADTISLPSSHVAMLSHPKEVAAVIMKAVDHN